MQKRAVLAWAQRKAAAFREARDRAAAERLWAVRRECSAAMFELGDAKLNEDIAIPMRQYERFAGLLDRLRRPVQPAYSHFRASRRRQPAREHHVSPARIPPNAARPRLRCSG